jgi:hypothetical protein
MGQELLQWIESKVGASLNLSQREESKIDNKKKAQMLYAKTLGIEIGDVSSRIIKRKKKKKIQNISQQR